MKKELVVKDNSLINASYNLDLAEQRLVLLAIIKARESQTSNNKDLTIHADSYINHFNVHRNTAYKVLKNACKSLFERRFSYQSITSKGNIENITSRWIQRISYVENEALVRIRFSDDVVPLIIKLEKHFTSYELEQVSNLTSTYAIRLYELIIAWRSVGKVPQINLEEFRSKLGVEEHEYKRMGQFKEKVLNIGIEQINQHTDILVEYEQYKNGRTITGFSFKFVQKQKLEEKTIEHLTEDASNTFIKLSEAQLDMFSSKLADLGEIQNMANIGEEMPVFKNRLRSMLKDPEKQKILTKYLKDVGFTVKSG